MLTRIHLGNRSRRGCQAQPNLHKEKNRRKIKKASQFFTDSPLTLFLSFNFCSELQSNYALLLSIIACNLSFD